MKKILVIDGHPYHKSFCSALVNAYYENSKNIADVKVLTLRNLKFDPILHAGYKERQSLESDLIDAQELVKWSEHIVIVSPIWWGGPPALLKAFFDRTFLPGFAFKYRPNSQLWDKYLSGRTGHLIVTSDAPAWWMRWVRGDSIVKSIKNSTLNFVGINPVTVTRLGGVRNYSEEKRKKILNQFKYSI